MKSEARPVALSIRYETTRPGSSADFLPRHLDRPAVVAGEVAGENVRGRRHRRKAEE